MLRLKTLINVNAVISFSSSIAIAVIPVAFVNSDEPIQAPATLASKSKNLHKTDKRIVSLKLPKILLCLW